MCWKKLNPVTNGNSPKSTPKFSQISPESKMHIIQLPHTKLNHRSSSHYSFQNLIKSMSTSIQLKCQNGITTSMRYHTHKYLLQHNKIEAANGVTCGAYFEMKEESHSACVGTNTLGLLKKNKTSAVYMYMQILCCIHSWNFVQYSLY